MNWTELNTNGLGQTQHGNNATKHSFQNFTYIKKYKIKLAVCLTTYRAMKTYGEVEA
jgi:hypothetical protein